LEGLECEFGGDKNKAMSLQKALESDILRYVLGLGLQALPATTWLAPRSQHPTLDRQFMAREDYRPVRRRDYVDDNDTRILSYSNKNG
tara:strand:- start:93 stop:356 length:264 start_codon:yes stop_codon:yes gene_type:complete